MRFFLPVVFALVALSCSCNGLYHFYMKALPDCDQVLNVTYIPPDQPTYQFSTLSAHGYFETISQSICSEEGKCDLIYLDMYRPDLADIPSHVREFVWGKYDECEDEQLSRDQVPTPYEDYEDYFEEREVAIFHGIKCWKFFNSSDSNATCVYGDEKGTKLIGASADGYDVIYSFSAVNHTVDEFKFDATKQPDCNQDSYSTPSQKYYDAACNDIPHFSWGKKFNLFKMMKNKKF